MVQKKKKMGTYEEDRYDNDCVKLKDKYDLELGQQTNIDGSFF